MITEPKTEYGPSQTVRDHTILRTTVGSQVHGIAIEGTDDHDEMAIYIPPPTDILRPLTEGEMPDMERYTARTQPEGARSGPGDTDLVAYSLRKYLGLAAKGNPTALLPLFAPSDMVLEVNEFGERLRDIRHRFLTVQAVHRFVGYMDAQYDRMMGTSRKNVPNRPELVEQHGYDTKYASHALRLAIQGWEVSNGNLSLPMRESDRQMVLAVKRGEWTREQVADQIGLIRDEIVGGGYGAKVLPPDVDWQFMAAWCTVTHMAYWRERGLAW